MGTLTEKVCLVTGGARGIGHAIGAAFVREGGAVYLGDIQHEKGRESAEAIGAAYLELDVREESAWEDCVARVVEERGRIDVLVNNAGITGFEESFEGHDPERVDIGIWRRVFATNLEGVVFGCKHGIRAMRGTGGSMINIGSRSGAVGVPGAAAYAASKAAVANHTRSVALYCAEQGVGIRCNVVQPAAVMTPMWDRMLGAPGSAGRAEAERVVASGCPLGRFGTPEEVAALVVYLASDASAYTTGSVFNVDGGMLAGSASPEGASRG